MTKFCLECPSLVLKSRNLPRKLGRTLFLTRERAANREPFRGVLLYLVAWSRFASCLQTDAPKAALALQRRRCFLLKATSFSATRNEMISNRSRPKAKFTRATRCGHQTAPR